jgi:hypothetical protein
VSVCLPRSALHKPHPSSCCLSIRCVYLPCVCPPVCVRVHLVCPSVCMSAQAATPAIHPPNRLPRVHQRMCICLSICLAA